MSRSVRAIGSGATRPEGSAARAPRLNFDSLAIGAPLTAALIGVLLTEGDGALGNAAASGSAAGGGVARPGDGEAGAAWHHDPAAARLGAAGQVAPAGQTTASSGGEIFDPLAASQKAAPAAFTSGAPGGTLVPPAGAPPASADGGGVVMAGMSVSFGLGAPPEGLDLGQGGATDVDGAQQTGRIGSVITGTTGDDVIHGTPFDDHLSGGDGNDTIFGHEGDDLLDGGAGDDQLLGGPGNDRLLGGTGNDGLFGEAGDDALLGGAGDDRLSGAAGRDLLDGGSGNDILDGGADPDRLSGGAGDDILVVDNIHDVAFGGGSGVAAAGSNTSVVQAGFATDLLEQMGVPRATFVFSENFGQSLPGNFAGHTQQIAGDIQNITLEGTANHDVVGDDLANVIIGNAGDNQLYGGSGDDSLHGSGGNDGLHGGLGDDQLHGDAGDDQLFGEVGNDILHGGAGDDTFFGATGDDLLYGEAGNDNFVIGLNDSGVDTVFDFEGQNWLTIEGGAGHRVQAALAGDQLQVVVDDNVVAVVDGYRGHEGAFVGIDTGAGLRSISDLLAPGTPNGPALDAASSAPAASTFAAPDDLLGAYLNQPSLMGTAGADHLVGTSGADWLVAAGGDDHLIGGDGRDVLQGGLGSDRLEGGAGDDHYLFKSGDGGFGTTIHDTEGSNVAVLDGFSGSQVQGIRMGNNLVVVANNSPIFTFEDFVGHEQAFAGVQVGDQFIATEEFA
jgi:Ca2+-binding RTX toxin-like protein